MALQWNNGKPLESGWYWCREKSRSPIILRFEPFPGYGLEPTSGPYSTEGWLMHGEIAGPIKPPRERITDAQRADNRD